jgi:glucosamine--fructose-6-phosphate aminotransferase (isomerizing)
MEFRHGPFAELQKGIQVLALVPEGKTVRQEATLLKEIASTGASVVPISNVPEIINSHADTIRMPSSISSEFAPLLFMIPMQFFAYYYTVKKGLNPDRPRNLVKFVTTDMAP